ncbi:hypothetical protein MRX96_037349 [Rhipicephalus microplus]
MSRNKVGDEAKRSGPSARELWRAEKATALALPRSRREPPPATRPAVGVSRAAPHSGPRRSYGNVNRSGSVRSLWLAEPLSQAQTSVTTVFFESSATGHKEHALDSCVQRYTKRRERVFRTTGYAKVGLYNIDYARLYNSSLVPTGFIFTLHE